jgi:tyrosine-protein phosphatase YwqE
LQSNGYKPVLAHPERYPFWFSNFTHYESLRAKGVMLQLNINSLTGHYSPATKKMAEQMIDRNMIDFVGSDCHHMGHQNLMRRALLEPKLRQVMESGMLKNTLLI